MAISPVLGKLTHMYKINIDSKNVIQGDTKVDLQREYAPGIVQLSTFIYWTLWALH